MPWRTLSLLLAGVFGSTCALAQTPSVTPPDAKLSATLEPPLHPATPAQIGEYYALTHAIDLAHKTMTQMLDGMQATSAPYYPRAFWDEIRTAFSKLDLESYFIPAYQRFFSEQDMAQVLVFYRSGAGQRLLLAQPSILASAQDVLRDAGASIGKEAYKHHREEIEAAKARLEAGQNASPATPKP